MEFLSMGFFEGIRELPNIHPLIVHFPIALFSVFLLAEFINFFINSEGLRSAASYTLYLGTLAAAATVLAGWRAESTITHTDAVHSIMESHEAFGITVLVIGIILSVWRLKRGRKFSPIERLVHLILAFVAVVVLSLGADLGGLMVYRYGVGVKAVKVEGRHDHSGSHDSDRVTVNSIEENHSAGAHAHEHKD